VGSLARLPYSPSLLDGLLDHVYPVGGWAAINQKLVLDQTPFRQCQWQHQCLWKRQCQWKHQCQWRHQRHQCQWAPNKPIKSCRTSSSECLFSGGQTQERRRFYNGSVRRRRALRFTGKGRREGRRYVTVIQIFIRISDLTADQVTLDPSMEVSDPQYCSSFA
jgi:hypothetical protein